MLTDEGHVLIVGPALGIEDADRPADVFERCGIQRRFARGQGCTVEAMSLVQAERRRSVNRSLAAAGGRERQSQESDCEYLFHGVGLFSYKQMPLLAVKADTVRLGGFGRVGHQSSVIDAHPFSLPTCTVAGVSPA